MTDDSKSEGQYGFIGGIVECPDGNYKITSGDKYIQEIKSQSYAEGRKSMEKDFKELLDNTGFLATILQVSILRRGPEVDGEGL